MNSKNLDNLKQNLNLFKKIIGISFFVFLIGSPVFAEELNVTIDERTHDAEDIYKQITPGRDPRDMYLSIYESTKKDIDQKTLERVSKQSNFSQEELESILGGVFTEGFRSKCESLFQSQTSQSLYSCMAILKDNYEYEKHLITLETSLKGDSDASEIWSDGDLSNSFFDLIVDLNIIEIILFGENTYQYPFGDSYNFDLFGEHNDGNSGSDQSDEVDDGVDGSEKNKDDSVDDSKICIDPDEIIFEKTIWTTNNNLISGSFSSSDNPYLGSRFQFPESGDNCSGESLFQGLLCLESWPCDNFFCVKISAAPQAIGGGSAKATFIQELITVGLEQLNYLKGHTLTVQKNSNERFIISVGKFFDRPISLDVITQGIPIKLVPKETAFDKEQGILAKLQTELCKELGFWCPENNNTVSNHLSKTINMQTEEGDLQQTTYRNILLNEEKLDLKFKEIQENFKQAQKIKHKQSFWEETKKNFNIMGLYFDSIKNAFMQLNTTGMDILYKTGNSCN